MKKQKGKTKYLLIAAIYGMVSFLLIQWIISYAPEIPFFYDYEEISKTDFGIFFPALLAYVALRTCEINSAKFLGKVEDVKLILNYLPLIGVFAGILVVMISLKSETSLGCLHIFLSTIFFMAFAGVALSPFFLLGKNGKKASNATRIYLSL